MDASLSELIERDSALAATLTDQTSARHRSSPGAAPTVLLTGVTGYLGGYIARDLLARGATVVCPVRGEDPGRRLRARLDELGVSPGAGAVAIPAEITQPDLGLSLPDYQRICDETDVIIHCAASVNLAAGYDRCRNSNVNATLEMLRVATTGRPKRLHHVSTFAIFFGSRAAGQHTVGAGDSPRAEDLPDAGYPATKLAAEHLITSALERGLLAPGHAVIHRVPMIPGDSAGVVNPQEITALTIVAFAESGAAPAMAHGIHGLLVDQASAAISAIALADPGQIAGTPAILNHFQQRVTAESFAQALRDTGRDISPVPAADWISQVTRQGGRQLDSGQRGATGILTLMRGMLPYIAEETAEHALPEFRDDQERQLLAQLGVPSPHITDSVLATIARNAVPPNARL